MRAWLTVAVDTGINQIPARGCVIIDVDQSRYTRDNFGLLRVAYKGQRFLVPMNILSVDPL
jgi:hypothetical protein